MGYFISCPITPKLFELFEELGGDDSLNTFRLTISTRPQLVLFLGGDADTFLPDNIDLPTKEESLLFVERYASELRNGTTYSDVSEHFVSTSRARWFTSL